MYKSALHSLEPLLTNEAMTTPLAELYQPLKPTEDEPVNYMNNLTQLWTAYKAHNFEEGLPLTRAVYKVDHLPHTGSPMDVTFEPALTPVEYKPTHYLTFSSTLPELLLESMLHDIVDLFKTTPNLASSHFLYLPFEQKEQVS